MVRNRRGLAPWSLSREAGIESATVDGTIEVPQYVQPVLDTGFVDEKGDWKGAKSSDKDFIAFQTDIGIAHSGEILTPSSNADGTWPLDMTGYNNLLIAIKPTSGGNYAITAVMGPASASFANLTPIDAAATLKIIDPTDRDAFSAVCVDTAETLTADVWTILNIQSRAKDQKLLRFKLVNNTGAQSTIETAFMRLV